MIVFLNLFYFPFCFYDINVFCFKLCTTSCILLVMDTKRIIFSSYAAALLICGGCATTNNKSLSVPRDGAVLKEASSIRHIVSARQLEKASVKEFERIKSRAKNNNKLANDNNPTLKKLILIEKKLKPHAVAWNADSSMWKWEVILIKSDSLNAFCFPGGKIVFFTGIIENLSLTDDEIAMIMGHEMAHALREHARSRMAKTQLTDIGTDILTSVLGLSKNERQIIGFGRQLVSLKFSRGDETDADLVGLDIAARGGFDPKASITLWGKMQKANKSSPPEWLSTHPSGKNRVNELTKHLSKVLPLYERALEDK
ncbi:MAG: hypothetical protein CBD16_02445 [Betaproteobacteria bacterium TMED156]|nr:MAG: hypothetical protein CBD16_02445 [Betaproteobacteria bacterium TMED156]